MRSIPPVAILIILAVFNWNSNAAGALPNLVQKWDKRIVNNTPTREVMNNPPAQALSGNDKLLEKKGELILLQERHRMFLLLAIVVSTYSSGPCFIFSQKGSQFFRRQLDPRYRVGTRH